MTTIFNNETIYQNIKISAGSIVSTGTTTYNNFKEENMEEKLNKYFKENEINVDDNGNFEMYVVISADDKDHMIGSIFHGKETVVWLEKRAYENLKEKKKSFYSLSDLSTMLNITRINPIEIEKKITIRDDLMTLKDKMFKVLINKENITNIADDVMYVNKYKVLEKISLSPVLKFKISSIDKNKIIVILYNSITEKSKSIIIDCSKSVSSLEDIKELINIYLKENDDQVELMNSIADFGTEL